MVFGPFWSEIGIHFAHFGLESDMVFEGTRGVYKRILSLQFQISKKKKRNMRIRNGFE